MSTGALPGTKDKKSRPEFLHFERLESRTPVKEVLPGRGIVERHRVNVDEAVAALERLAHVDKRPERTAGGRHPRGTGRACRRSAPRRAWPNNTCNRYRRGATRAAPRNPAFSTPNSAWLARHPKVPPGDQIGRTRKLDIDPLVASLGLRRIGVIITVRCPDRGRVGKVGVDHWVRVSGRSGSRHSCTARQDKRGECDQAEREAVHTTTISVDLRTRKGFSSLVREPIGRR